MFGLPIDPELEADDAIGVDGRRSRLPQFSLDVVLVVFAGGVLGGLARYAIERAVRTPTREFPWDVLVINACGAFALALLMILITEGRRSPNRYLRPAIGTGFLGAFTTFSSLAVATDQLTSHDRVGIAAAYLFVSIFAGLAAALLGLLAGRRVTRGGTR